MEPGCRWCCWTNHGVQDCSSWGEYAWWSDTILASSTFWDIDLVDYHRRRRLRGGDGGGQRDQPARGEEQRFSQYVGYHARDRNNGSSMAEFYGYPQDEATKPPNWLQMKYQETTLLDVWMCWVLAVAWASWMLGSFVKSELLRYGQGSITVKGNVRMVTLDEASLGTGFPVYKAVIDYMIPAQLCNGRYDNPAMYPPSGAAAAAAAPGAAAHPYPVVPSTFGASTMELSDYNSRDDATASRPPGLQIRKEFETLHPLEQGFGNVELLVLHHEPTTSILKEDWEQQVLEEMEESRSRRRASSKLGFCGCVHKFCRCLDGVCCGFGKDAYGEHLIWKRVWIGFCLLMMLVSMGGCVLSVHKLPDDLRRLGWLCLCLASLLVIPVALVIRLSLTSVQRSVIPQGRAGIIVSDSPSFSSTPTMKNHRKASGTSNNNNQLQHAGLVWGDAKAQSEMPFCMDPSDVLDVQVCEEDEVTSLEQTREQIQHQSSGEGFVVRLPGGVEGKASDVSEMSGNSHSAPLNPIEEPSDDNESGNSTKSRKGSILMSGVLA